jgi:hypothetical protein
MKKDESDSNVEQQLSGDETHIPPSDKIRNKSKKAHPNNKEGKRRRSIPIMNWVEWRKVNLALKLT